MQNTRFNPWVRKTPPGEGQGNPLQYSFLENPMDRGAWRATVCGVAKIWTQLSNWVHIQFCHHWEKQEWDWDRLGNWGLIPWMSQRLNLRRVSLSLEPSSWLLWSCVCDSRSANVSALGYDSCTCIKCSIIIKNVPRYWDVREQNCWRTLQSEQVNASIDF